jgi:prepilin-type N-terminal cleavage/methylation domain-containing protein
MQNIRLPIRNQRGFTLIEIVMVIVLLGVLAAIAIPKYVDLKKDAQNATADGIVASISSAAAIGYAKSAIAGTATYPTITTLDTTYLNVKNVEAWDIANANYFTGDIKGLVYTFTYLQSDGSAQRSSP